VAAQLERDLGVTTQLVPGGSGELSVWVDGAQVIAKQGARFPEPAEVVAAVRDHRPPMA
jgi:predicted Rdx family selenoprotein